MNYKLLVAAVVALTICMASSCNKPAKQAQQADNLDVYTTPVPSDKGLSMDQSLDNTGALGGDGEVARSTASDGVGPDPSIHASAMEAWNLVETSYLVIERRWHESAELMASGDTELVEQGKQIRQEVNIEIEQVIFGINETVENLFKDAIDQEPDSPENLATFAFYLKPRRRQVAGSIKTTDIEAFKLLDQAIEMDPDNALWYLLKIHAKTSPHLCHNWFREYAEEKIAIQRWLPEIRQLFDKAEGADPDNGYINYYNAILLNKYSDPGPDFSVRDEMLREIRAGNQKEYVNFFFPPPLPPFADFFWSPVLRETNYTAVFVDHWNQFSMHDMQDIDIMLTRLGSTMSWPEDKDDIGELMLMLYQLGRTQPYDRSFFGLQLKLLQPIAENVEKGSDDALMFAEVLRYLNDQYQTVGNGLFSGGEIVDSTKIGVIGIHEVERGYSHRRPLAYLIQRHQKAFLKRAGEIMGLEFELFEQPNDE